MIEVIPVRTAAQKETIFEIRRKVFVIEQNVDPKEEYDQFEESSEQFLALDNGTPSGTCRRRKTDKGIKLERFAVLADARGRQIGAALVKKSLEGLEPEQLVYLHAQVQVVEFYAKFGFEKIGPQFEEANIQHYKMIRKG